MSNDPTDPRSTYADALSQAADDLGDALSHVIAEQDSGRLSPLGACLERVDLLERHLERLKQLRAEHLGESDPRPADDDGSSEPYCRACGARVGIFQGYGEAWHHFRGAGTAASPVELYDPDHPAEVAWRPAGDAS